ncbi:MAG: cytochrome c [Betaproteobacteria bacterium]|nr:cytochrome c [Betaproteobacteria bacterium]
MTGRIFLVSVFAAVLWPSLVLADAGSAILSKDCVGCHNLKGPAPQTLKELWERQGPDLFYAGNKYRQTWIVEWLQKPQRIRPAGEFYGQHIQSGAGGKDVIDTSTLKPHMALSKEEATSVAAELEKLRPHDDLIAKEKVSVAPISKQMGEMVFDKFQGCLACHTIEANYGGLSGPELYTAGRRLQPEYIASYIRNPQAWDPKSWMPNKHVSDANIQKLVNYIEVLSTESRNVK